MSKHDKTRTSNPNSGQTVTVNAAPLPKEVAANLRQMHEEDPERIPHPDTCVMVEIPAHMHMTPDGQVILRVPIGPNMFRGAGRLAMHPNPVGAFAETLVQGVVAQRASVIIRRDMAAVEILQAAGLPVPGKEDVPGKEEDIGDRVSTLLAHTTPLDD